MGTPDAPAALFHVHSIGDIPVGAEKQRQFQRLRRQPRQIREFQKRNALRVFINLVDVHNPVRRESQMEIVVNDSQHGSNAYGHCSRQTGGLIGIQRAPSSVLSTRASVGRPRR